MVSRWKTFGKIVSRKIKFLFKKMSVERPNKVHRFCLRRSGSPSPQAGWSSVSWLRDSQVSALCAKACNTASPRAAETLGYGPDHVISYLLTSVQLIKAQSKVNS